MNVKKYTKKQILQLFKEHFLYLVFAFLLLICSTGMTIPIPLLSRNIINSILTKSISSNLFKIQIILLLMVSLLKEFLMYISYYIFESRMRFFSSSLRKTIFEVAQNNFNQISSLETGRLLTYISSDTERIQKFFYPSLVFFMKDLPTFSFALTVGLFLNPLTIVVSILLLVIFFVLAHYVNPKIRVLTHKALESQTEFVSRLKEYIQGMEMFRVFLKQKFSITKFKEFNDEYTKNDIRRVKSIILFNIPLAILFNSGYVIAIIEGVYQMKIGTMQAGGLVAVLMVVNYIYYSARNFWDFNIHRQEIKVVSKRLSEILETPFTKRCDITAGQQHLNGKIESLKIYIPSFSYKSGTLLLENFKLHPKKVKLLGFLEKVE